MEDSRKLVHADPAWLILECALSIIAWKGHPKWILLLWGFLWRVRVLEELCHDWRLTNSTDQPLLRWLFWGSVWSVIRCTEGETLSLTAPL